MAKDPFTGLELQEITPYPKFGDPPAIQPIIGQQSSQPIAGSAPVPAEIAAPEVNQPSGSGVPSSSLLDKVLFTLLGTPDSMLSDEERAKKQRGRARASASATSAATNPGEAHMGIPNAGGSSLGESLAPVLQGIYSLFDGKKGSGFGDG